MEQPDNKGRIAHADSPQKSAEGSKTTSSRTFNVSGRAVEIRATYQIFVDGKPYTLKFNVGSDGKIFTHLLPYESFASLVDMVSAVIRSFPNSFGKAGGDDNA